MSYLADSYIVFTLIMESVRKITIFGLKMMVKSGLEKIFQNSTMAFRVAAAQCKKICPERLNWPGRLVGNSEGASRISK